MKWLPYSALFLWLAITGVVHGFPLFTNAILSIALVGFILWNRPAIKPLTPYLLAVLAVQLVSFFYNHSTDIFPVWQTVVWIALYNLPVKRENLQTGALFAALIYALISPFLDTNTNIIAFNLWTLYFLSHRRENWFRLLIFVAMVITKSEGGLLALGIGIAYQQFGGRVIWFSPVALVGIWAIKQWGWWGGHTNSVRVAMLIHAWQGWLQSPWIGNYAGYSFTRANGWHAWHAHNIIADIAFQAGVSGLIILLCVGLSFYFRRWIPTAFTVAFIVHSMVDSPLWFFLPAVALFMELAQYDYNPDTIWSIDWLNIRRHRLGSGVARQTPFGVDTRATAGRVAHTTD